MRGGGGGGLKWREGLDGVFKRYCRRPQRQEGRREGEGGEMKDEDGV